MRRAGVTGQTLKTVGALAGLGVLLALIGAVAGYTIHETTRPDFGMTVHTERATPHPAKLFYGRIAPEESRGQ